MTGLLHVALAAINTRVVISFQACIIFQLLLLYMYLC